MAIVRNKNSFLHQCASCNKEELLKYPTYWHRITKGTNQCNSCSKKGGNRTSFKKGLKPWNKALKDYQKGHPPYFIAIGQSNPAWKGGKTPTNLRIRNSDQYARWRKKVLERDNYTCQFCFQYGGKLHVDHIKPFAYFADLRFDLSNARTLCINCHKKTDTYLSKARHYGNNS